MSDNPYASLPPERYWRRAVAEVPPFELNPTRADAFRLSREERIATIGSCFAQNVAGFLRGVGLNVYVAEPPPPDLDPVEASQWSNFSALYGNVYTTRQLAQLFGRAFGTFAPALASWERPDGRHVDPFRPRLPAGGYPSAEAVVAARDGHLACVREMFTRLDTLIVTLGLTEGWRDRRDGAALPLPPGVAGGEWDESRYVFANAGVAEMTADMIGFVDALRAVNPGARLVVTVSPVPIVATYEDRHVMVSNGFTKSALRVVADEVCRARPNVHYFPGYEIVAGPATAGRYLSENLRSVTPAGIDHVMRLFLSHTAGAGGAAPADVASARLEGARLAEILCDEEALDA